MFLHINVSKSPQIVKWRQCSIVSSHYFFKNNYSRNLMRFGRPWAHNSFQKSISHTVSRCFRMKSMKMHPTCVRRRRRSLPVRCWVWSRWAPVEGAEYLVPIYRSKMREIRPNEENRRWADSIGGVRGGVKRAWLEVGGPKCHSP